MRQAQGPKLPPPDFQKLSKQIQDEWLASTPQNQIKTDFQMLHDKLDVIISMLSQIIEK